MQILYEYQLFEEKRFCLIISYSVNRLLRLRHIAEHIAN